MELENLKSLIEKEGFSHFGVTTLEKPLSIAHYKTWLDKGYQADMEYLKRHLEQKENPQSLLKKAQTAIVIAHPYYPVENVQPTHFNKLKIAMYARQPDYHEWFQSKLDNLRDKLKTLLPEEEFMGFTDSKPVLERDLAYRAGLGWIGKNTCLIHEKKGSLFFIGEIYSTLKLQTVSDIQPDRCGTCTKCIDICPTGALEAPRVLNSNKCISYWTIEAKATPPLDLRKHFQNWYFGCDLCQTVCPWNQKLFKQEMLQEQAPYTTNDLIVLQKELLIILNASDLEIKELFKNTPLMRAKPWAHKRNAIIVATNYKLSELSPTIAQFTSDEKLKELATWSLETLSPT